MFLSQSILEYEDHTDLCKPMSSVEQIRPFHDHCMLPFLKPAITEGLCKDHEMN